jgi:hypothetical protein
MRSSSIGTRTFIVAGSRLLMRFLGDASGTCQAG